MAAVYRIFGAEMRDYLPSKAIRYQWNSILTDAGCPEELRP
jgi:hypothetical protein